MADHGGFRAAVRSNEPGVISSEPADAPISKSHSHLPLSVAATSIDTSASSYGTRLKTDSSSRVSYANDDDDSSPQQERLGSAQEEIRQSSYDDYRPRNPVAYYPSGAADSATPLKPSLRAASGLPSRSQSLNPAAYYPSGAAQSSPPLKPPLRAASEVPSRSQSPNPSEETRPLDVYLPPIDPHTVVRRPSFLIPRERISDQSPYTTSSRRPFIPPYGGFDDDPVPVPRRPEISMSTIHGGLGRNDFESTQTSSPSYGAGRYPSDDSSLSRDFITSRFPQRSNFPPLPRLPGGLLSSPPRRIPGPVFEPPSYDTRVSSPNFVLRAIPIPNGIQAVRVDPETGRVYEKLIYPLFLKEGQPVYDKNILLHNDDASDDAFFRNHDLDHFDIPYRRRPSYQRSIRNPALDESDSYGNITRRFNRTLDPLALSIPTARDMEWVRRQLSQVEGYGRDRNSDPSVFRNTQFDNNEFPLFNDFDDSPDENLDSEERHYSRNRDSELSGRSFSRDPRLVDRLTPEDTKEIVSKSENVAADFKSSETNPEPSVVKKER